MWNNLANYPQEPAKNVYNWSQELINGEGGREKRLRVGVDGKEASQEAAQKEKHWRNITRTGATAEHLLM